MISNNLRFDLLTPQLFVAVVEEQSLVQAAEKKHIAVSVVSRRGSRCGSMHASSSPTWPNSACNRPA